MNINQIIWNTQVLEVKISRPILDVLDQIYIVYGSMDDTILEAMSQEEPWKKNQRTFIL